MVVQPGSLIFKTQMIRGFWLLYCYQSAKADEITVMFDHLRADCRRHDLNPGRRHLPFLPS
jgi:hypothetical protein